MKKLSLLLTLPLIALCATGCDALDKIKDILPFPQDEEAGKGEHKGDGGGGDKVKLTSIELVETGTTLKVGDEPYKIQYTVLPEGASQGVVFGSNDYEIATVDDEGYVTAISHGSTTITIESVQNPLIATDFAVYVADSEEEVINYNVYFDANGGQGQMASKKTTGPLFVVPTCSFTNPGHTFNGWALSDPEGQKYHSGSTIQGISDDITLYATWVEYDPNNYYASISDDLTGNDLLRELNQLNTRNKRQNVTYAGMKSFAKKCDANPDNPNKIVGFYDNAAIGPDWDGAKTWNREHVWPNARGGSSVEADAHMVRPASVKTNSDRGSKGFGTGSYDPGTSVAYYRGVASRIILYCAIANTSLKLSEDPFDHDYTAADPSNTMGCLSDMLRWNLQYLPSDTSFSGADDLARRTELNRNDVIEKDKDGQGNRNPFIDHPEYACRIWGGTNSSTRAICGM